MEKKDSWLELVVGHMNQNLKNLEADFKALKNTAKKLEKSDKAELAAIVDALAALEEQIVWVGGLLQMTIEMAYHNHTWITDTSDYLIKIAQKVDDKKEVEELKNKLAELEKHKPNLEWMKKFFEQQPTSKD